MKLTGEQRKTIALEVLKEIESHAKDFCDIESVIIHLDGYADWALKDIGVECDK